MPSAAGIDKWPICLTTSIQFWWNAPATGAPLTKYTLSCVSPTITIDLSANVQTYTITGLTIAATYAFTITATNGVGTGPAAAFPVVSTGLPPLPPSAATATRVNQTAALVTWTPSTTVNVAPTKWYTITGFPSSIGMSSFYATQYANQSSITIRQLTTGVNYQFLVQAVADPSYSAAARYTSSVFIQADYLSTFGQANEGGTVTLSTANGNPFLSTIFASYGTPTGSNGNYTIGPCHATNSATFVMAAAAGKSTFSIAANNSVFGDPCNGTSKRLYITMLYAA